MNDLLNEDSDVPQGTCYMRRVMFPERPTIWRQWHSGSDLLHEEDKTGSNQSDFKNVSNMGRVKWYITSAMKPLFCVHEVTGLIPGHHNWFTSAFFFFGDLWGSLLELQSPRSVDALVKKLDAQLPEIKHTWGNSKYRYNKVPHILIILTILKA